MTAFAALIEDMGNWDKDKRFMAASDLTNEITTTAMSLDPHLQKRICSAFVKQLEDASIEVQGNAVKCLARIVLRPLQLMDSDKRILPKILFWHSSFGSFSTVSRWVVVLGYRRNRNPRTRLRSASSTNS